MKKIDYLKLVIENKTYSKKSWMIMAFSITRENADKYLSDSYIGRLVNQDWGYSFINKDLQLVKIDDAVPNEPLFTFKDKLIVDNTWLQNIKDSTPTTIGNLLVNAICIASVFGSKIDYLTGPITVSRVENIIAKNLQDNPKDGIMSDKFFYVQEYIKFVDSLQYISSLTQLSSYAATPKILVAPTGIKEFKKQLLEKYKGKLNDPVELSKFEKELLAFDSEFLKDDPANGKFISGKIKNIARKKMFLDMGGEAGFSESLDLVPITNSLEEGWPTDPVQFAALLNTLRAGSFSRGAETIKGGVTAKVLLRAANNFKIIDKDCNSNLGIRRFYNEEDIEQLIGRYVIVNNKTIFIENKDMANNYKEKNIVVRSPMYCKLEGDNICKVCAGAKLSKQPTGITISLTDISNIIIATSMSAMHSKELTTQKMEIEKVFS